MPGSFRLFKITGISIEVNASWLLIVILLTASLALVWFPTTVPRQPAAVYWAVGFIATLLLFGSVLLHELAHSLVARARGLPVKRITLFIFGGVSDLEREPQSPAVEFQMAFVGPCTSLLIGGLALLADVLIGGKPALVAATLWYLGVTNLLLGVFNLIPGFPLDGGRVLRSIIWKATGSLRTATQWAARIGQGVAFLLILVGVWMLFRSDVINGLWFGFIGWFLLQAAQAENTHVMLEALFKGVTLDQLIAPPGAVVGETTSVQNLVDQYMLPHALHSLPVLRGEVLVGLVSLQDVRRIPRDRWAQTVVGEIMTSRKQLQVVHPSDSLNAVLPLVAARGVDQVPVVDAADRLVGVISHEAIVRYIEIRRGLDRNSGGERLAQARREQAPPTAEDRHDDRLPEAS